MKAFSTTYTTQTQFNLDFQQQNVFFADTRGPVFSRTFSGETDYNVRDSLATVADVWSGCGDSVNMRVNTAMTAKGQGMATVDSFDLAHRGLVYHIKYRTCRKN
ncbi:DUF4360 domain-containing protein [Nostoc sp. NMS7]|uniref:DUF4360 domain-containing protein n=1 Tax=Nostoc sp. NMS7 TaxID=2815391 RepID=UPI0025DB68BB|nr:DUF4360 domain-containing protein [Nostoc sp. NMS7]